MVFKVHGASVAPMSIAKVAKLIQKTYSKNVFYGIKQATGAECDRWDTNGLKEKLFLKIFPFGRYGKVKVRDCEVYGVGENALLEPGLVFLQLYRLARSHRGQVA